MVRRIVCTLFMLTLCVGLVLAEEFSASITKVEGGKVTFAKTKFDKDTKKFDRGPEQTLPVADNVKVVKSKFNQETKKLEAGDAIEGGLKNEMFTKIGEKGLFSTLVTDADNKKITEIRVSPFFGKGKGFKKKDGK
jgi:hypothetical protein